VPACGGFRAPVVRERRYFLLRGHIRRLARIKTDEYNFVIAPSVERKHLQRADNTLLHLIAKHWTTVINQSEEDGFVAEVIAEVDIAAIFVAETSIQW